MFVEFDGIYMNSDVWINGNHLGHRPYGYVALVYDLTPYLKDGENILAVRVDTLKAPSGRWYTGSGIYRHTWLKITQDTYIPQWGTYVTTPIVSEQEAQVSIEATICNDSGQPKEIQIFSKILDAYKRIVAESKKIEQIVSQGSNVITSNTVIKDPVLWSPDSPNLYQVKTQIMENGNLLDEYDTTFGVRYFEFDPNTGFSLNGKSIKFQGVCHHHDAGPVGAAVPEKVLERRLRLLKEMGCNAIRASHNPMAQEFYDMCNKMGFMVMEEAFDGWDVPKAPYDYGIYFKDWWQKDLADIVRRSRNHPCIILWSIGNEVTQITPERTKELIDFVHQWDTTRPVTCGIQQPDQRSDDCRQVLDVAGYNEGGGACFVYERDHLNHPERTFIATEACHSFQTRGFYRTQTWWRDKFGQKVEVENLTSEEIFFDGALQYNSSYDNSGVRTSCRDSWNIVKQHPYLAGEFRWTGFDYLGESFGWPARMANFGILDLCGFPKDSYYFYQSQWTNKPMVHMLPHWTHPGMEGIIIPIWVYSNCDCVELFLNEESLGKKETDEKMYLSWDVPYSHGTIKAVGYRNNMIVTEEINQTSLGANKILLEADNTNLLADSRDISHVVFKIADHKGVYYPPSDNLIKLHIRGPIKNLGMENGDPLDLTPHKVNYRNAFYGMGMGIFQSTEEIGDISITAIGILGEKVFKDKSKITIALSHIALCGNLPAAVYEIYYTLDGSAPGRNSIPYRQTFEISETCTIRAVVIENGVELIQIEEEYQKGEKEKVIDLLHGNKKIEGIVKFPGPFSDRIVGDWTANDSSEYYFSEDGELYKRMGMIFKQVVGYWWYDFPADAFETPDYAGVGEVLWISGQKSSLALQTQKGDVLEMVTDGKVTIMIKR